MATQKYSQITLEEINTQRNKENKMKGMKKVVMCVLMLVLSITIFAQVTDDCPFGLRMGMSYDEVRKIDPSIEKVTDDAYVIHVVPYMDHDIEYYILIISDNHGLCKIVASGNKIETSVYGYELKSKYTEFKDMLKNKYCPNYEFEEYDFLQYGSIWDEPRDFMMSLYKKERVMSSFITSKSTTDNINGISSILIDVQVNSTTSGCMILGYEFNNFGLYKTELDQKKTNKF